MLCQCPALLCQCLTPPCSANALTCDVATQFALPARWTASICPCVSVLCQRIGAQSLTSPLRFNAVLLPKQYLSVPCLCLAPHSSAIAELDRPMPPLCCVAPSELGLCLPFRCCNVLVRAMPTLNFAQPVLNSTVLCRCGTSPCYAGAERRSTMPMLRPSVRCLCADSRRCRGLLCDADALLTNAHASLRVSAMPSFAAPMPCRT